IIFDAVIFNLPRVVVSVMSIAGIVSLAIGLIMGFSISTMLISTVALLSIFVGSIFMLRQVSVRRGLKTSDVIKLFSLKVIGRPALSGNLNKNLTNLENSLGKKDKVWLNLSNKLKTEIINYKKEAAKSDNPYGTAIKCLEKAFVDTPVDKIIENIKVHAPPQGGKWKSIEIKEIILANLPGNLSEEEEKTVTDVLFNTLKELGRIRPSLQNTFASLFKPVNLLKAVGYGTGAAVFVGMAPVVAAVQPVYEEPIQISEETVTPGEIEEMAEKVLQEEGVVVPDPKIVAFSELAKNRINVVAAFETERGVRGVPARYEYLKHNMIWQYDYRSFEYELQGRGKSTEGMIWRQLNPEYQTKYQEGTKTVTVAYIRHIGMNVDGDGKIWYKDIYYDKDNKEIGWEAKNLDGSIHKFDGEGISYAGEKHLFMQRDLKGVGYAYYIEGGEAKNPDGSKHKFDGTGVLWEDYLYNVRKMVAEAETVTLKDGSVWEINSFTYNGGVITDQGYYLRASQIEGVTTAEGFFKYILPNRLGSYVEEAINNKNSLYSELTISEKEIPSNLYTVIPKPIGVRLGRTQDMLPYAWKCLHTGYYLGAAESALKVIEYREGKDINDKSGARYLQNKLSLPVYNDIIPVKGKEPNEVIGEYNALLEIGEAHRIIIANYQQMGDYKSAREWEDKLKADYPAAGEWLSDLYKRGARENLEAGNLEVAALWCEAWWMTFGSQFVSDYKQMEREGGYNYNLEVKDIVGRYSNIDGFVGISDLAIDVYTQLDDQENLKKWQDLKGKHNQAQSFSFIFVNAVNYNFNINPQLAKEYGAMWLLFFEEVSLKRVNEIKQEGGINYDVPVDDFVADNSLAFDLWAISSQMKSLDPENGEHYRQLYEQCKQAGIAGSLSQNLINYIAYHQEKGNIERLKEGADNWEEIFGPVRDMEYKKLVNSGGIDYNKIEPEELNSFWVLTDDYKLSEIMYSVYSKEGNLVEAEKYKNKLDNYKEWKVSSLNGMYMIAFRTAMGNEDIERALRIAKGYEEIFGGSIDEQYATIDWKPEEKVEISLTEKDIHKIPTAQEKIETLYKIVDFFDGILNQFKGLIIRIGNLLGIKVYEEKVIDIPEGKETVLSQLVIGEEMVVDVDGIEPGELISNKWAIVDLREMQAALKEYKEDKGEVNDFVEGVEGKYEKIDKVKSLDFILVTGMNENAGLGDEAFRRGDLEEAERYYRISLNYADEIIADFEGGAREKLEKLNQENIDFRGEELNDVVADYALAFNYLQAVKNKAEILERLEINSAKQVDKDPVFSPGEELVVQIKKDENGNFAFYINGQKLKTNAGIVYNPVPSGYYGPTYAVHYKNLKEIAPTLSRLGIKKIRVYGLTVPMEKPSESNVRETAQYEDEIADVEELKNIFREVHSEYGLRVTLGYWAGLWDKPNDEKAILAEAERVVGLYGDEDWLLGWVLGNENDRCILEDTPEGSKQIIYKNAEDYYKFQDTVAGVMKQAQGKNQQPIFFSWSYRDPVTDKKVNEKHINYINQMENIDGVLVNAYLDEAGQYREMKEMFRDDLVVGLGEYGMSTEVVSEEEQKKWLEDITPELEEIFGTLI
ncbi:hypothetical protein KAU39_05305, partial [bacterium]|nr:hypothetical protein [bacterium]